MKKKLLESKLEDKYVNTEWIVLEDTNDCEKEPVTIYKKYNYKEPLFIAELRKRFFLEKPDNYIPVTTTFKNVFNSIVKLFKLGAELKRATYIPPVIITKTKNLINKKRG